MELVGVLGRGFDRSDDVDQDPGGIGDDEVPLSEALTARGERRGESYADHEAFPLGVHVGHLEVEQ